MKGGSALYTAKAVHVARVSHEIAQEWGECVWTAADLCDREFQARLDDRAVRSLIIG